MPLDARRLAATLRERHHALSPGSDGSRLELYHRASLSMRFAKVRGEASTVRLGHETGLAARVATASGIGFAACSGDAPPHARWVVARATLAATEGEAGSADVSQWHAGVEEPLQDVDGGVRLPTRGELEGWLEKAWEALAEVGGQALRPTEAWVEAAQTVETWCADDRAPASRVRARGWAMATVLAAGQSAPVAPRVVIASRRWPELPVQGWSAVLLDRCRVGQPSKDKPIKGDRFDLLVGPEASATLVTALVKQVHGATGRPGAPVGAAWSVTDDPREASALFGGLFDDAGYPTGGRVLADGHRVADRFTGPGSFRRPSVRDRPAELPSHLVVPERGDAPPESGILVSTLRLHALEPHRWVLEIDGAWIVSGRPGPALGRGFVRTSPEELVQRCCGAVGPARPSPLGVRTPALVFEGLEVGV